jgi:hypothetical protein
VWAYVEGLDLTPLYQQIHVVAGEGGRPATHPKLLLALWLYATLEGVGSARALSRDMRGPGHTLRADAAYRGRRARCQAKIVRREVAGATDGPGSWRGATRRGPGWTTLLGGAALAGYAAMESGGLCACVGQRPG